MTRNEAYNCLREARKLPALPDWFEWQRDAGGEGAPTVSWVSQDTLVTYLAADNALDIIDSGELAFSRIYLPLQVIKALQEAHDMVTVYMKEMVDG